MNISRTIDGHQVNIEASKNGVPRLAAVLVGAPDRAGMRAQDGSAAKAERKRIRGIVAAALDLPLSKVRAVSRFTELEERDGVIVRKDAAGEVIGVHLPA